MSKQYKPLGIKYDFNAITALEEYGMNVFDQASLAKMELSPSVIRKFVHAGILHKQPNASLEDAGKLITIDNMESVIKEVQTALTKFFSGSK